VLSNPGNRLQTDSAGRVTVGSNMDKSNYSLSASERQSIASAVWDYVVEGSLMAVQLFRIMISVLFGKRTVTNDSFTYYGLDGSTVRVQGSVDLDRNRNINTLNGG
jgi:hypothetical protein